MVQRCGEVGQGRGDDPLCLADGEHIPPFGFADKMRGADATVVEAAVEGERKVIVVWRGDDDWSERLAA